MISMHNFLFAPTLGNQADCLIRLMEPMISIFKKNCKKIEHFIIFFIITSDIKEN